MNHENCKKCDHSECQLKKKNKPGSAQVGAISKVQKYQKDFGMSKYW